LIEQFGKFCKFKYIATVHNNNEYYEIEKERERIETHFRGSALYIHPQECDYISLCDLGLQANSITYL
jgi:hypothetical protein